MIISTWYASVYKLIWLHISDFLLTIYAFCQVEQACSALSALASDGSVAMQLMKSDIMQPIERVLKSTGSKEVISVLQVVVKLAFTSDIVAQKLLTKDILKSLKLLCAHKNPEASFIACFFHVLIFTSCFVNVFAQKEGLSYLGSKISFICGWKFCFLFGKPSCTGHFRKSARTSFAADSCT